MSKDHQCDFFFLKLIKLVLKTLQLIKLVLETLQLIKLVLGTHQLIKIMLLFLKVCLEGVKNINIHNGDGMNALDIAFQGN